MEFLNFDGLFENWKMFLQLKEQKNGEWLPNTFYFILKNKKSMGYQTCT